MRNRDAIAAELIEEPDAILEAIVAGELGATVTTRELARQELAHRRSSRPRDLRAWSLGDAPPAEHVLGVDRAELEHGLGELDGS